MTTAFRPPYPEGKVLDPRVGEDIVEFLFPASITLTQMSFFPADSYCWRFLLIRNDIFRYPAKQKAASHPARRMS